MAEEPISETLIVTAIYLRGLPREFLTIIIFLEAEDAPLTVSSIQPKLCSMEQTIRDARNLSPETMAMFTGKSNVICEFCKRPGHTEDRCYTKDPANNIKFPPNAKPASATVMTARTLEAPKTMSNPNDGLVGG
jgi:hypothetical protein